jgi:hypothetical protein
MENDIFELIKALAILITSLVTILGVPKGLFLLYKNLKQRAIDKAQKAKESKEREDRQDADIAQMKNEFRLVIYGLSACLDGLIQQGCNHTVPEAKEKIDKYLNKQAHK